MADIEILREKFNLVKGDDYKKIRKHQIDKIISLANSDVDPLILKGMLKLIAKTDEWQCDYEKETKKQK